MALTRIPTQFDDPKSFVIIGGNLWNMGLTGPPIGYKVPDFNIICQHKKGHGWTVRIDINQVAHEGSNTSYYLGPGLHRSGLMLSNGALGSYTPGPNNREIYRNVTAHISNLSYRAEEEHCKDIIRAYKITLQAAQKAISTAKETLQQARTKYDKRGQAMRAALNALVNQQGLHNTLKNIFRKTIDVKWSFDRNTFKSEIGKLYINTADLTVHRDQNLWHTFDIERNHESWSAASWGNYISSLYYGASTVDVRDMTTTNIQVGMTPPNAIINI